jgi:hypothetical protein
MTAEMTDKLAKLQAALQGWGMQVQIVPEAPSNGDLIVLGRYSGGSDITKYTKLFGLTMDSLGEYTRLAPFGKIGQSGNGILLYRTGTSGNTLVVLASNSSDMNSLLGKLSDGDLSDCVMQGNLAVCSVGFGGSFLESTPTSTPVVTPTAAG